VTNRLKTPKDVQSVDKELVINDIVSNVYEIVDTQLIFLLFSVVHKYKFEVFQRKRKTIWMNKISRLM